MYIITKIVIPYLFLLAGSITLCCSPSAANADLTSPLSLRNGPTPTPAKLERPRVSGRIRIAAVGDMMLGSTYPNASRMPPEDGRGLLAHAAETLTAADLAFGNLEGPLADGGVSAKCGPKGRPNCYAFRIPTRYGKYLKEAGFDILSVANNHAGDFGASGRASTRAVLDRLGIMHAGSDSGRFSTAYLKVSAKTVAFVGFATNNISLNVNRLAEARAAVELADKRADIVVVSFHAGAEGATARRVPERTEIFFNERRGNLPLFSRTVIDAGADLVIGHGPHVLRGMQIYKDRLIAYSLGNFATYGWFRLLNETAESMILEVELDETGEFTGGRIHPYVLKGRGIPTPDPGGSAIKTVRTLSELDFPDSAPVIGEDGSLGRRKKGRADKR